jgi:hypothetical protein
MVRAVRPAPGSARKGRIRRQPGRRDHDKRGHRRRAAHAPVSRKCRRTIPGRIAVQSAQDGIVRCGTRAWHYLIIKSVARTDRPARSPPARRPSTGITSLPSKGVRVRPRARNSTGLRILTRHCAAGRRRRSAIFGRRGMATRSAARRASTLYHRYLRTLPPDQVDRLRGNLRIGVRVDLGVREIAGPRPDRECLTRSVRRFRSQALKCRQATDLSEPHPYA